MTQLSMPRLVSISDIQRKARTVFKELDDEQPTIILNRNRSIGVVIKPSVYETIMEDLEDLYAAERLDELVKKKDEIDFASWEELEQKLIKVGKLRPS